MALPVDFWSIRQTQTTLADLNGEVTSSRTCTACLWCDRLDDGGGDKHAYGVLADQMMAYTNTTYVRVRSKSYEHCPFMHVGVRGDQRKTCLINYQKNKALKRNVRKQSSTGYDLHARCSMSRIPTRYTYVYTRQNSKRVRREQKARSPSVSSAQTGPSKMNWPTIWRTLRFGFRAGRPRGEIGEANGFERQSMSPKNISPNKQVVKHQKWHTI
jgi:hypothetical protein